MAGPYSIVDVLHCDNAAWTGNPDHFSEHLCRIRHSDEEQAGMHHVERVRREPGGHGVGTRDPNVA
jgi:hypothetical protein